MMRQVKTNYVALLLLSIIAIFCGALAIRSAQETLPHYDVGQPVKRVEIGDSTVTVPSWNLFKTGRIWNLVSSMHHLETAFTPQLTETAVAHAPGATKVSQQIAGPLESMVAGASSGGVSLMLSSAYRSAADQQAVYTALSALYGQSYAESYVAAPGASEHQTGLAVDIATRSAGCETDANTCSLDAGGIAWLRAHAADYGFIERYPSGKQSITGVAGEHWHYRYVGVPLAKALTTAGMTLDEFVAQTAPGYAR